ncbi:MAG TPA: tetratricopeptide repeat protein, partial [Phycisphaerae bacterium]|nr:tetratricopeptide repeat protein [Phycisphaerae bacterium]
ILQRTGESRKAIDVATAALEIDGTNNEALMARAAANEALGENTRVKEDLERVSQDDPAFLAARARFLASQKKPQEGIDLLQDALTKNPAQPQLVAAAADIYTKMQQPDKARQVIEAALAVSPDNFDLRLAKLRYSDLSDAERRDAYTKLVGTLPDEYDRAIRLAGVYGNEDDTAALRAELETAKDLLERKATPAAREAGEPAMRSVVDRLFELYARTEDFTALDKLIEDAGAWNDGAGLDGAESLSYRGRRMLVDGFVAATQAADAADNDDQDRAQRLRDQAQDNYRKAIDTLQLALDKFPSSGETYAQLGEAFLQTNRLAEARAAMEKSNDLLPNNPAVLKRLAVICRRMNDESSFESWLARCKDVIPNDPWVVEQSVAVEEEANPREGIARREELRKSNPDDLQNLSALARLYSKIGDSAKAEECVDAMLATKDADQYTTGIAALLREIGKPERALDLLEDHLRKAPDDQKAEAQLLIADHYAAIQSPKADAAYLAAADIDPNETVCLAIGQHFLRTGRPPAAEDWFAKAFKLAKESKSVRLPVIYQIRIDCALRQDKLDEARALCDGFKDSYKDDPTGSFLEAEVLSKAGKIDEAIAAINRYLDQSRESGDRLSDYRRKVALYRRALLNRSLGNWQEVIEDLVQLVGADPTALDFKPRLLLSAAYDNVGRPDAAVQELESVYHDHPEATAVVQELIDRYIRDQRYGDADRVLAAMLSRDPENPAWLVRSGDVAVKQGDRTKALANYKLAAKVAGYTPQTTNRFFDACRELKLPDQGIEFFEKSIPPGQQTPEVILGYARLLAARGDTDRAVEMCRLALYRKGFGSFEFLNELAVSILNMMGRDALVKFEEPPSEQTFARANQHLLSLLLDFNGKSAEAAKIDEDLLKSSSDPAEQSNILFRRGLAAAQDNSPEAARQAYEDALQKDNRNMAALNNLAYLLADSKDADTRKAAVNYAMEAVELANAQGARSSMVVDTLDTLGWAYICADNPLNAISKLNDALEINPQYVPATYHLGEAYRRNGQFEEAEQKFNEVLKTSKGSGFDQYVKLAQEGLDKAQSRQSD